MSVGAEVLTDTNTCQFYQLARLQPGMSAWYIFVRKTNLENWVCLLTLQTRPETTQRLLDKVPEETLGKVDR